MTEDEREVGPSSVRGWFSAADNHNDDISYLRCRASLSSSRTYKKYVFACSCQILTYHAQDELSGENAEVYLFQWLSSTDKKLDIVPIVC